MVVSYQGIVQGEEVGPSGDLQLKRLLELPEPALAWPRIYCLKVGPSAHVN
jgi:hypothetical protein